jgi:hypothetical protein
MNDIEIALEDLDTLVEIARQHTGIASWLGLVQSALIMKEALEKQTPKEIIYDYGLNETRCPRCNTIFGYAYEEDETEDMYYAPYCYECGQCLDWEVENE